MKVSDFIVKYLSTKTDKVFGGQGGSILHIADSLVKDLERLVH